MKRPLTLIGGILGTLAHVVFAGYMMLILLILFDLVANFGGKVESAWGIILYVVVPIAAIVMNIITATAWNKTHEKYKKRLPIIIITLVLNVAVSVLLLVAVMPDAPFVAIIAAAEIIASVMILIDIILERKKVAEVASEGLISNQPSNDVNEKSEN